MHLATASLTSYDDPSARVNTSPSAARDGFFGSSVGELVPTASRQDEEEDQQPESRMAQTSVAGCSSGCHRHRVDLLDQLLQGRERHPQGLRAVGDPGHAELLEPVERRCCPGSRSR